jgi:chromosome segregation ATPase
MSSLGTQTTIENWRARLSRAESKHHALHISRKELAIQVRDQEAELAARAKRLQLAGKENEVLKERVDRAKAEVTAQWEQAEKAETSRKEMEVEWQTVMDSKSEEAETLAAALRDGGATTTVTTSEEISSLQQVLAERDQLVAMLQRRLQSLERQKERETATVPQDDLVLDMDRSLFLFGEEEQATEQDQEIIDLADQVASDDLGEIRGIGSATQRRLNELGIRTFRQIAAWSETDVHEWAERLETAPDSIHEMAWVHQAKELLNEDGQQPSS